MSQPAEIDPGVGPPRHGYQGDRGAPTAARMAPLGLAVAISREAGARGGTVARLAAEKLAWQVYDQELLEYTAQNPVIRQGMMNDLPPACVDWVTHRLKELERTCGLGPDADVHHQAEVILALGAQGQVVLIGRGAGCVLPRETTLNVRVVAPLRERVAYMGQWLRMSSADAAERVRQRDERRAEFVQRHFRRAPADVHQYDLVLNSSLLGEDGCAELIARAARLRWGQVTEIGG
ncbi:MAG: cytidylate kinase-like family protein [Gemmataceae bacterium]